MAFETQTHIHTIIRNIKRCRDLISLQSHLHLLGFAYFYGILCSMAILSQLLNVFIVSYADTYTFICIHMQCSQCVDTGFRYWLVFAILFDVSASKLFFLFYSLSCMYEHFHSKNLIIYKFTRCHYIFF